MSLNTFLMSSFFIGFGATLVMDLWLMFRKRFLGVAGLNYAFLGRWIAYLPRGQFRHANMGQVPALRGELWIGWAAHYSIGISFAALLVGVGGLSWLERPTLALPLVIGLGTAVAPLFILQPAMGLGMAGSKTPNPNQNRLRSVITHGVYGVGLYAAGILYSLYRLKQISCT